MEYNKLNGKRCCIYTTITGGYDELRQPTFYNPSYDYICFCNEMPVGYDGVWEIRHFDTQKYNAKMSSRIPKMMPDVLLPEYEYSLYIDANVDILDDFIFNSIDALIADNVIVGHLDHVQRNCMYLEIDFCMLNGYDLFLPLARMYWKLLKEKYPYGAGLFENNVIFRKHNDPIVVKANRIWWDCYCRYSKRDQCSLMYAYWKTDIRPELLLPEKTNARLYSTHVSRFLHNDGKDRKEDHSSVAYCFFKMMNKLLHSGVILSGLRNRTLDKYNENYYIPQPFRQINKQ